MSFSLTEQGGAKERTFGDVSTIVLRGSTDAGLDDVEHAIDNAVNNYRVLCKDPRTLPGDLRISPQRHGQTLVQNIIVIRTDYLLCITPN